jgi:hypothetical protein
MNFSDSQTKKFIFLLSFLVFGLAVLSALGAGLYVQIPIIIIITGCIYFFLRSVSYYKKVDACLGEKLGYTYYANIPQELKPDYEDYFLKGSTLEDFLIGQYKGIAVKTYRIVEHERGQVPTSYYCAEFKTARTYSDVKIRPRETLLALGVKDIISTESEEFNKKFIISTKDPEGALEILQPDIMAKLLDFDFAANMDLSWLRLVFFKNNSVGVAVATSAGTHNIFEPIFNSPQVAADARTLYIGHLLDNISQMLRLFEG